MGYYIAYKIWVKFYYMKGLKHFFRNSTINSIKQKNSVKCIKSTVNHPFFCLIRMLVGGITLFFSFYNVVVSSQHFRPVHKG